MTPETFKALTAGLSPEEREHLAGELLEVFSPLGDLEAFLQPDSVLDFHARQKLAEIAERVVTIQTSWALSSALCKSAVFSAQMAAADARWESGDQATMGLDEFEKLILS